MSSTLDKEKQKEEEEKRKRKEKKERQKRTEEENLKKIELQQSEKIRLNYVFNQLCELENEKSSDDDSKTKKYLRAINEKAKKKQMKIEKPKYKSNFEKANKKILSSSLCNLVASFIISSKFCHPWKPPQ